jgi:hypothetical protein
VTLRCIKLYLLMQQTVDIKNTGIQTNDSYNCPILSHFQQVILGFNLQPVIQMVQATNKYPPFVWRTYILLILDG